MKAERDAINEIVTKEGDQVLWRDLRSYGDSARLISKVFGHPKFRSWTEGTHRLHLFLDSFDECRLEIKKLASVLADELKEYEDARARLILRIACRTADWLGVLEADLKEIWGAHAVRAYELAPLTKDDVRIAAADESFNPDEFLSEVHVREVGPLAAKPITLRLLLNLYRNREKLPLTQTELYAKGCKLLAEETSPSYVEAEQTGNLLPPRRIMVAARIAAVTVFGQKSAIWTSTDFGDVLGEDVRIEDLSGGTEIADSKTFEVDPSGVDETIHTGLFTSRGVNRMGWAHQTYAEFLAAWYLTQQELTTEQVLELIVHPEDLEGKIVPQLHETAAWLASMRPDLFQEIMRREPKVLLQSDVAAADTSSRAALVDELLKLYDEEKDFDDDWFIGARYRKLNHPDLASQFRPYIKNRDKGFMVRRMALQMAGDCKTRELQGDLLEVALEREESADIRFYAAHAVARAGDRETIAKLKPLAAGHAGDDPDHELMAVALKALWPEELSAEELFTFIVNPGVNDSGSYGSFLAHGITEHLKPEDLPTALHWVEKQRSSHHLNYYLRLLVDQIMLLGWENLQAPSVLEAFARAAVSRVRNHDAIIEDHYSGTSFREMLIADNEKRRLVLESMLPMLADPSQSGSTLVYTATQTALSKDVPWLLKCLLEEKVEQRSLAWAALIKACWNYGDPDQLELIYQACQVNQALADTFRWVFRAVPLDSQEAKDRRKAEAMRRKKEGEGEEEMNRKHLKTPPAARIAQFLEASEAGDPDAWWNLNVWMWVENDGYASVDESEPNLKILPGWQKSDAGTRRRIIAAAKRYLLEREVQTSDWADGAVKTMRPAEAGYRALRLLLEEDPTFMSGLDNEVWKKWAPIILSYHLPLEADEREKEVQRRLGGMAYRHAPEEIIKTLMADLDQSNRERGSVSIPEALDDCWDERLCNALLDKAKEPETRPLSLSHLLRALDPHDDGAAKSYAEALLGIPLPADEEGKQKAVSGASFLVEQSRSASWPIIWPALRSDAEFGRALIQRIVYKLSEQREKRAWLTEQLTADELADLYIWMVGQYPYEDDPRHKGIHQITPRERATRWRDSLLERLKERGDHEACAALNRIADTFPELKFIKRYALEAKSLLRRRTWTPLSPEMIIAISAEQQKRISLKEENVRIDKIFQALWVLECDLEGNQVYGDTCSQGTAFMLSGVGLVTCQHVLCPHMKAFKSSEPDKKYKVKIIAQDEARDFAVLSLIDAPASPALTARWSPPLDRKELITVAGFPRYNVGHTGVLRNGEVVGMRPENNTILALVDAPIIVGNSGGPVLDSESRVVGIALKGVERIEDAHTTERHAVLPITELRSLLSSAAAGTLANHS